MNNIGKKTYEHLIELLYKKEDKEITISSETMNYVFDYVNNLQSKIDKVNEYCEYNNECLYTFELDYDYEENITDNYVPSSFREDILEIIKEDK